MQEIPCKPPLPNAVDICSICYQTPPQSLPTKNPVIKLQGVPTAVFSYWGWSCLCSETCSPVPHSLASWCPSISPLIGVKLLLLSVPCLQGSAAVSGAQMLLSVPLLGPKSWHCLPSLGYTDIALRSTLWVLSHGFDLALLRLSCCGSVPCALEPGAGLWPTIPRVCSCCTLSTHSMCHYCISPSWGHKSLWWVPRTQTLAAWKMCTCLHLGHWGQHHCECTGAAGPRYFPMGLIPDPGATATERQCAKSGTKKDPLG